MWSLQLPRSNYRYDNPESSREDRLTRNYANFFNISLAGFLFFLAFGSSALCGDDKDFCTPAKTLRKEPLFLSRTLKIEKRKFKDARCASWNLWTSFVRSRERKQFADFNNWATSSSSKKREPTDFNPNFGKLKYQHMKPIKFLSSTKPAFFILHWDVNILSKRFCVYFCNYLQPCSNTDQQKRAPIELSGYRIVDVGYLQQSLKSCNHCKSGKY